MPVKESFNLGNSSEAQENLFVNRGTIHFLSGETCSGQITRLDARMAGMKRYCPGQTRTHCRPFHHLGQMSLTLRSKVPNRRIRSRWQDQDLNPSLKKNKQKKSLPSLLHHTHLPRRTLLTSPWPGPMSLTQRAPASSEGAARRTALPQSAIILSRSTVKLHLCSKTKLKASV